MKIAFAVVYLINDQMTPLLAQHLESIRRTTDVPYTIYAVALRCSPEVTKHLAAEPDINLCNVPPTTLKVGDEHAYYLDQLISHAAQDDQVTHLVTLHLDTILLRSGWTRELAQTLVPPYVITSIDEGNTAFMIFTRDFYLQCRTRFRLTPVELQNAEMISFFRRERINLHSGAGFYYAAAQRGLRWHFLPNTSGGTPADAQQTFGDFVFHINGTAQQRAWPSLYSFCAWLGRAILPVYVRQFLRRTFPVFFEGLDSGRLRWRFKNISAAAQKYASD